MYKGEIFGVPLFWFTEGGKLFIVCKNKGEPTGVLIVEGVTSETPSIFAHADNPIEVLVFSCVDGETPLVLFNSILSVDRVDAAVYTS